MIQVRYSFAYYRAGGFLTSFNNVETCKELAGSDFKVGKKKNLIFYHPDCENKLVTIQEYFNLLGFNKKVRLEDACDSRDIIKKVFVVDVANVVEFEIAAIIIKTICNKNLDNVPVNLGNFTGEYLTPAVKSIFKNLPIFLENLTDEMIADCGYNFFSHNRHGGLVNWASKGIFKNKLTKRRLWRNILYGN